MAEKLEYQVTDAAGPRPDVYGRRRRVGDTIFMTPDEAVHEVSRGVVRLVGETSADQAPAAEIKAAAPALEGPAVVEEPARVEVASEVASEVVSEGGKSRGK